MYRFTMIRFYSHSELLWSSLSLKEVLIHWFSKAIKRKSLSKCEVFLVQLATSAGLPRRRRSIIQKDRMILELKHRFASNLVSIEEYLSGVSDL